MVTTGKPLSELASIMPRIPQTLVNLRIAERKPLEEAPTLGKVMRDEEKALGANGRVLVRFSGTEPLLRIMVEATEQSVMESCAQRLAQGGGAGFRSGLMDGKLLVVDVGNTQTVLGVYDGEELVADWRVSTNRERTTDELGVLAGSLFAAKGLSTDEVKGVIVSSVVPPLNRVLNNFCRSYLGTKPSFRGTRHQIRHAHTL